jgi:hypothetical protein
MTEYDPSGKGPGENGAKLDGGKPPVWQGVIDYFPNALIGLACVSAFGAEKYTWKGWEAVSDGQTRYNNALARHQIKQAKGEWEPADDRLLELLIQAGLPASPELAHQAQIIWNACAVFEMMVKHGKQGG